MRRAVESREGVGRGGEGGRMRGSSCSSFFLRGGMFVEVLVLAIVSFSLFVEIVGSLVCGVDDVDDGDDDRDGNL